MVIEAKVRKIGNSLGIVLAKEVLQSMKVEEGASLYLSEAPRCSIQIHAEKPHFKKKVEAAEDIMRGTVIHSANWRSKGACLARLAQSIACPFRWNGRHSR